MCVAKQFVDCLVLKLDLKKLACSWTFWSQLDHWIQISQLKDIKIKRNNI